MKKISLVATWLLALGGCTTTAQAPAYSGLSQADLDALTAAAQLVAFDMQECALLPSRQLAPPVAAVASKICSDAAHFQPILEQLAAKHGVTLPNKLSYNMEAQYSTLFYRPYPSFDVNYLQDQISSHEQTLAVFDEEVQQSTDPDLKALAQMAIPVVQVNLQSLRRTLDAIGGK